MHACMLHVYIDMYRLYIERNTYLLTYWELMLKHDVYRIHIFPLYIKHWIKLHSIFRRQLTVDLPSSSPLGSACFTWLLDCCCFLLVKRDSFVLLIVWLFLAFVVCGFPCFPRFSCLFACLLLVVSLLCLFVSLFTSTMVYPIQSNPSISSIWTPSHKDEVPLKTTDSVRKSQKSRSEKLTPSRYLGASENQPVEGLDPTRVIPVETVGWVGPRGVFCAKDW